MKKNNGNLDLFLSVFGFITSSVFNIFVFFLTIFLIYFATTKAIGYGDKFANEMVAEKPSKEVIVAIPEEANIWDIATILKQKDLINNEYMFMIETGFNGTSNLLKPGIYNLNSNMKTSKILEILQSVQNQVSTEGDLKITIPEGLTLYQMAELFQSKKLFEIEEFMEACQNYESTLDFVNDIPERPNRLEGYLFPDTYFFTIDPTPNEIISKMLTRFDEIYTPDLRQLTEAAGLTIDDVVIISSIIEEEISIEKEREIASAIIYNRLDTEIPLQMCSSIMYALDKRKDRLLLSDLEINSPYNTYISAGLPIGPISNPGEKSIVAALNPADVDYLYFVLKNEETGEHVFTVDYDEFVDAKDIYNQKF